MSGPCTVDGCERPTLARGWCGTHYSRWRITGTTDDPVRDRPVSCGEDGCDAEPYRRDLCRKHYERWRIAEIPGNACTIDGCAAKHYGRGWCRKHYERWHEHGDPTIVLSPAGGGYRASSAIRGATPSYDAMHIRLRRDRGLATGHVCVDCGEQAAQWSYDHEDPDERRERVERPVCCGWPGVLTYSLDPAHYQARCRSCHGRLDQRRAAARRAQRRRVAA